MSALFEFRFDVQRRVLGVDLLDGAGGDLGGGRFAAGRIAARTPPDVGGVDGDLLSAAAWSAFEFGREVVAEEFVRFEFRVVEGVLVRYKL